jgi:DNA polymerase-3 subunit beta
MGFTAMEGPCGVSGKDDLDYTVIIMPMKMTDTTYYEEDA